MNYDYIIVGAGSAGCVLANQLSIDPDAKVLVLEAGGDARDMRIRMPLLATKLWDDPSVNWNYTTEPLKECDGQRLDVPRGKILGGCSSINGMIYARGHPLDYDEWEKRGARGWGYKDVLPAFKKIESHWLGETEYHGADGPLTVRISPIRTPLTGPILEAARQCGFPVSDDPSGAQPEGFSAPEVTVDHRGRRASTNEAFLQPVSARPNLTVHTGAHVTRVIIERGIATGVEYIRDGQLCTARADREIILSGGALNSPQILMLSGVGPADALTRLGIDVAADLPGVGQNLQDHLLVGMEARCKKPYSFDREMRLDRLLAAVLQWSLTGKGQASAVPMPAIGYIRTRPELDRPDIQYIFAAVGGAARPWFPGIVKPAGDAFMARNILLHPESRGSVTLSSADPLAKPLIQLNLLSSRNDVATIRQSIKVMRNMISQSPLAELCLGEYLPGSGVKTDAEIDAYVRQTANTAYHPVGTCAMGEGSDAVVDPDLKVRGVQNLRVADASVMPTIPGGNTNAAAIMIGMRASDFILADRHTTKRRGGS